MQIMQVLLKRLAAFQPNRLFADNYLPLAYIIALMPTSVSRRPEKKNGTFCFLFRRNSKCWIQTFRLTRASAAAVEADISALCDITESGYAELRVLAVHHKEVKNGCFIYKSATNEFLFCFCFVLCLLVPL